MIKQIQEVKAELQVALFSKPGEVVVLQNARIHLHQARIPINVARLATLRPLSRRAEIGGRKDSVDVARAAVRPGKTLTGCVRDVVIDSVEVGVAAVGCKHVWCNYRTSRGCTGTRSRSTPLVAHHVSRTVVNHPEWSACLDGDYTGHLPAVGQHLGKASFQSRQVVQPRE